MGHSVLYPPVCYIDTIEGALFATTRCYTSVSVLSIEENATNKRRTMNLNRKTIHTTEYFIYSTQVK